MDRPPNRWLNCPRKAGHLLADKFLAFKTPLSEKYDEHVPMANRFGPEMLFTLIKSYKAEIGLWVDLTNTSRFYDRKVIEAHGCKYLKLSCRGHGETPSDEQVKLFIGIIKNYIEQNPLKLIGVHCTHGFNRTGFMIVSYLVEEYAVEVGAALVAFANARPPGIYKKDYIDELYRRYDDEADAPPAPDLPDWCIEYDDSGRDGYDDDVEASKEGSSGGGESGGGRKTKRRREFQNRNAVFMEGVSGVYLMQEQPRLSALQRKVQDMCSWDKPGFPGSQPVSMDTNNINKLAVKPYRVSWKADGTRYMMLIEKRDEIYFFDRDHSVFRIEGMCFPHRKNIDRHLVDTLVDGEMVMDKVDGQDIPRYLVYDIIKFEGNDVSKSPFYPTRLKCIECEIIGPRHAAMKEGRIERNKEPFSVRNKSFWDITQAANLLGPKFAKTLSHEPDGLIFQPSLDPYVPGRCDEVLKWKPLSMNSVDFKLQITQESGMGILPKKIGHLFVGQLERPFDKMRYTKAIKDMNNKIIECKYQNNEWVFMRERTDKSFPNSYNTAAAVCNSIKDPVTTDKLLNFIHMNRFRDDNDLMPPPAKMVRR